MTEITYIKADGPFIGEPKKRSEVMELKPTMIICFPADLEAAKRIIKSTT